MSERYYNINEITAMFGVTRTTVYDWMNSGRLEYVVIGARRRITQAQLDAFIQSGAKSESGLEGLSEKHEKNGTPGLIPVMAI